MGAPRTWTPLVDVAKRDETPRKATSFNCRSEAGTDRQQTLQGSESSREDEPVSERGGGRWSERNRWAHRKRESLRVRGTQCPRWPITYKTLKG